MHTTLPNPRKPTTVLSLSLFLALVGVMAYVRLDLYRHEYVTLSYGLPLLLCLWYRDVRLLWAMALAFACLTTFKAWVILPHFDPADLQVLGQWVMQLANIAISAGVVHLVIELMQSLRARQKELERTNAILRERERNLSNVEEVLRRQNERLSLLSDALAALLRGHDPQRTLRDFFPRVAELLAVDTFLNYIVDETGTVLELQAWAGLPDAVANDIRHLQFGEALCGTVALTRQPVTATHIQEHQEPKCGLVRSLGMQAYCCHPLESGTQLIGTLSFGSRTRTEFSADDIEFARVIARYVAVAIDRARSGEELQRRVESRTQELRLTITSLETAMEDRRLAEQQVRERHAELSGLTGQLRALTMELTQAEEQERRRLAQMLHDNLQPLLLAARVQLKTAMDGIHGAQQLERLQRADAILRDAAQESRSLTVQLTPPVLHEFGLAHALRWLAEWSQQHLLEVTIDLQAQSPPGHPVSILLFQCARELLLNVVKHAGVSTATLALRYSTPGILELEVRDEGSGFRENPAGASLKSGFGLFSIRERLNYLGGTMTVDSQPGRGTRIVVQVPVPVEEEADIESLPFPSSLPDDSAFLPEHSQAQEGRA